MDFSQKFEFGSGLAWSGLAGSKVSTAAHFSCHCQPLWSPPTAAFLQKTVAHLISEAASKMKYKNTRQKLTTSRHQDQSITPFFHSHSQDAWWHTATDPLPCSMFRSARQRCDGPSPPPASRPRSPAPGPRPVTKTWTTHGGRRTLRPDPAQPASLRPSDVTSAPCHWLHFKDLTPRTSASMHHTDSPMSFLVLGATPVPAPTA